MFRFWTPLCLASTLAFGLFSSACNDGGDDVHIDAVAPGEDCAEGGLKITVNGTSHLTCNGEKNADSSFSSEYIAFGEEGNPCSGDALRITLKEEGKEPTVSWSCNADITPANPSAKLVHALVFNVIKAGLITQSNWEDCNSDDEPFFTPELREAILSLADRCVLDHVNLLKEFSDETAEFLTCATPQTDDLISCLEDHTQNAPLCAHPDDSDQPVDLFDYCMDEVGERDCDDLLSENVDLELDRLDFLLEYVVGVCELDAFLLP